MSSKLISQDDALDYGENMSAQTWRMAKAEARRALAIGIGIGIAGTLAALGIAALLR